MTSWVYLFSKFTAEALIFEGLAITFLCAAYAAFWVLRKRRLGVIQTEVPGGVVKTYLSELIFDAEQLRAQLFGLLASSGVQIGERVARMAMPEATSAPTATVSVSDPDAQKKLVALEAKMAEQARAMETLVSEKSRIEKELTAARGQGAGSSGSDPELPKLQEKVQLLESRLAEYSVIEDDLANLKRLQQENAQLKAQLTGAGAPAPTAAAAAPAPVAPAPTAPAEAAPKQDAAPIDLLSTGGGADAAFEGLVDQVEQSLEKGPEAPLAMAEPAASSAMKSDEDLVAEFEKMLSS